MPDLSEVLEHADRVVERDVPLPRFGIDELRRRRARRHRNRRLRAGVFGVAVALVVAVAGARALRMGSAPVNPPSPVTSPARAAELDATITDAPLGCELADGPRIVPPGRLKLKMVNDSGLEAYFRVVRLRPSRRMSDLAELHSLPRLGGPRVTFVEPGGSDVWSSMGTIESGRWAVVCYEDRDLGAHGFFIVSVGVVGPVRIG